MGSAPEASILKQERPDTFAFRAGSALVSGYVAGAFMGGAQANWSDVPLVLRNKSLPALLRTGRIMNSWGLTLAAVAGSFAVADYAAESIRDEKDWKNGVIGGLAAGAALGMRLGRGPGSTVGAMASLAAVSFFVDISGQKLVGEGLVDDGATPAPQIYPFKQ